MGYLSHAVLGPRLKQCVEAVLAVSGRTLHQIFGSPDDIKFRCSRTLFALESGEVCNRHSVSLLLLKTEWQFPLSQGRLEESRFTSVSDSLGVSSRPTSKVARD